MTRAVEDVLEEIGTGEQPRILVLNKADAIDAERRRELAFRHPDAVLVSALTGEGLDELGERIAAEFERTLRDVELLVPFSEGGTLSELHEFAGDLDREDTADGVRISARLPAVVAERYDRYAVNGNGAAATETCPGPPYWRGGTEPLREWISGLREAGCPARGGAPRLGPWEHTTNPRSPHHATRTPPQARSRRDRRVHAPRRGLPHPVRRRRRPALGRRPEGRPAATSPPRPSASRPAPRRSRRRTSTSTSTALGSAAGDDMLGRVRLDVAARRRQAGVRRHRPHAGRRRATCAGRAHDRPRRRHGPVPRRLPRPPRRPPDRAARGAGVLGRVVHRRRHARLEGRATATGRSSS